MIELTQEQVAALQSQTNGPLHLVNPVTHEVFVLIKQDVYKLTCGILRPFSRNWDNPADDDLIPKQM
jgi:hypothetical protein